MTDSLHGPMVHICFAPKQQPLASLRKLAKTPEGWKEVVLAWDRIYNNYYDKTPAERQWVEQVEKLLRRTIPKGMHKG